MPQPPNSNALRWAVIAWSLAWFLMWSVATVHSLRHPAPASEALPFALWRTGALLCAWAGAFAYRGLGRR